MAKSFKELGKKAETLIEQGRNADQRVLAFQSSVAAATRQVAAARSQLSSARETDENGQPKGNVEQAQAQLNIAQNQLAASQRALSGARKEADQIRRQKTAHAQEIETHNKIERENIEKLKKLSSGPFSADSVSLTRGMAERFNEAEDTRVALLKSMGIEATPDHIPLDGALSAAIEWRMGGFGPLDLSGKAMSIQGGEGAFAAPGLLGSGTISPVERDSIAVPSPTSGTSPQEKTPIPAHSVPDNSVDSERAFRTGYMDTEDSISKKIAELKSLREQLLYVASLQYARAEAEGIAKAGKVKKLSAQDRYEMGLRYIDSILEVYRDNLRNRGVSDGDAMEVALASIRLDLLSRLNKDIEDGTYLFYDHETPDFEKLASEVRNLYSKYPPKYRINDFERERIREGIRNGTVTEKEIRSIGSNLREHYDALISERNAEWDRISCAQKDLAVRFKSATTKEERENLELQRKLIMQLENTYHQKYNNVAMMKAILQSYRPVGPAANSIPQPYQSGSMMGSSKVIHAIESVREAIPTDWVNKGNERTIIVKHVNRGYFFSGADKDTIALSGNESHMSSCAFHEMGHRFESIYPEILKLEKQFYERRTMGEQLAHLGPGYGDNEVSRFDHFIDPYMGKDYGGTGYELLSMGMEAAFCRTYNLSLDTDYQDFIFGILAAV